MRRSARPAVLGWHCSRFLRWGLRDDRGDVHEFHADTFFNTIYSANTILSMCGLTGKTQRWGFRFGSYGLRRCSGGINMDFLHTDFSGDNDDVYRSTLDSQANVNCSTTSIFPPIRDGRSFNYFGGWATKSPIRLVFRLIQPLACGCGPGGTSGTSVCDINWIVRSQSA